MLLRIWLLTQIAIIWTKQCSISSISSWMQCYLILFLLTILIPQLFSKICQIMQKENSSNDFMQLDNCWPAAPVGSWQKGQNKKYRPMWEGNYFSTPCMYTRKLKPNVTVLKAYTLLPIHKHYALCSKTAGLLDLQAKLWHQTDCLLWGLAYKGNKFSIVIFSVFYS